MLKSFLNRLSGSNRLIKVRILKGKEQSVLECKVGSNLMDITNTLVNQNVNIYGLCDKQLACTTCRVDIENCSEKLNRPSQEQLDVLLTTPRFNEKTSRMACQIILNQEHDGITIRIPENINRSKI